MRADPAEWASYRAEARLTDNAAVIACRPPVTSTHSITVEPIAPDRAWQCGGWVDFGTTVGHEQGGVRPAAVVGSATHCRFLIDMALVVL